ncbi:MAG TPA: DeoR/GlpR family DNA-binding transcription regulator [Spirochaetia bacterium]|nr:DeoR/GlpR family DNA-binding transcription regulator [Spirochaetia bacterium]
MTKTEIRIIRLVEMLQHRQRLDVNSVAGELSISEATVRRLFAQAERERKVIRVHGGVQLSPQITHDYSYRVSAAHRSLQKTLIGNIAAGLVEDNDRLFLDSGTTVLKLAEALSVRLQTGRLKNLTVLTNSFTHIETLASWCKVILIGGEVRVERRDVCGSLAEKIIQMFHVEKAFFGADAVSIDAGFTTTDERTSRMQELIMQRAASSFILVDSEKFDRISFVGFAGLSEVDGVITDDEISPVLRKKYSDAGARFWVGTP